VSGTCKANDSPEPRTKTVRNQVACVRDRSRSSTVVGVIFACERRVLPISRTVLPLQSSKMNMSPMRHRILDGRSHVEVGRSDTGASVMSAAPGKDGYSSPSQRGMTEEPTRHRQTKNPLHGGALRSLPIRFWRSRWNALARCSVVFAPNGVCL
jgi:hypothetical protein